MPRYFFHVTDSVTILDTDGSDLANDREAREEAVQTAAQVLATFTNGRFWNGQPWTVQVFDHNGQDVARIAVKGTHRS